MGHRPPPSPAKAGCFGRLRSLTFGPGFDQPLRRFRRPAVTLVEILVVLAILGTLAALLLPAVQKVREMANRTQCAAKLKQIGLALHNYHTVHDSLPIGFYLNANNSRSPSLGWTAKVLPYLERDSLAGEIEQAFETDPNPFAFFGDQDQLQILRMVVADFTCPSDPRGALAAELGGGVQAGLTSYLGVSGVNAFSLDGVLFMDGQTAMAQITDGTSNTLMVGERPPSADLRFGWWYRGFGQRATGSAEMIMGVEEPNLMGGRYECPPGPYPFGRGTIHNQCDMFHFWSLHPGGANFGFADGGVRFLSYSARPVMRALATRSGGEVVDSSSY